MKAAAIEGKDFWSLEVLIDVFLWPADAGERDVPADGIESNVTARRRQFIVVGCDRVPERAALRFQPAGRSDENAVGGDLGRHFGPRQDGNGVTQV